MSADTAAAVMAREGARAAALIGKRIRDWEKFADEFGEDAEISVLTIIAELEMLVNQITHAKAKNK